MDSKLLRTTSEHADFRDLVSRLDAELAERDGPDHAFYHQFNGIEALERAVVLFVEGRPVGCGALKAFDKDALEIKRMYTLPGFRGKGVAGRILGELERWTWADGYARCVLETGKRQPEAIALYEKYNYRRIRNFGPYEGVENSVCFEKRATDAEN